MAQRQGRNSALTRLQREIDLGNALKEPYTTPEKAVDIDIRTAAEKTRLLKWADNYTPIPWDDQVIAYWPEDQEQKDNNKKLVEDEGSREDIQETCVLNETSNTSLETYEPCQRLATPPTLPNTITNTPGISRAFGQFTLEPEPSLLPIPKTISSREAKKLAQNELCFDILDHDERLQALPREAIPVPPSITYGLGTELEQLVHDWEFGRTLVINECFIPLVHWRDIYKEYFPKWWAAIKQHWSRWRFIFYSFVACDRSWRKFWNKYGGKFTSSTKLLNLMRLERATLDREDAKLARQESDFSSLYLTRKEGDTRRQTMHLDIDIARRYRERHDLELRWWHTLK